MATYQPLDLIDDASAALILKLQEQDAEELIESKKGKGKDGELSDADLALITFQKQVQEMSTIIADRSMSRSITRAVITDAVALKESVEEETRAEGDRTMARRLNGATVENTHVANADPSDVEDTLAARLFEFYISPSMKVDSGLIDDDENDAQPLVESSSWAASRNAAHKTYQCISCGFAKPLFELLRAPCNHYYCVGCLQTLFRLSTSDETIFPPRCCRQQIPFVSAKLYLDPKLIELFQKKSVEFRTSDRTYCFQSSCSAFIPPYLIEGDRGTCQDCNESTCTICKGQSHEGDCPEDHGTEEVLNLASAEGWQRCFKCKRVIELSTGCNHIRCICAAQFCYVRGLRWKTCTCAHYEIHHILDRAEQLVERDDLAGQPDEEQPRDIRVAQAVEQLRQNHDYNAAFKLAIGADETGFDGPEMPRRNCSKDSKEECVHDLSSKEMEG